MDVHKFKGLLLKEKKDIETTLSSLGTQSSKNPGEWEPRYPDLNATPADKNDMADEVEEFDNALGIETALEEKLRDVDAALKHIEEGTYGACEKGGEPIPTKRLLANPAARTCIEHSK